MKNTKSSISKRKALSIVLIVAAILIALILLRGCSEEQDYSSLEGRQTYLNSLGWEIDPTTEDIRTVQLPQVLDETLEAYNEMQMQQGFDLTRHLGEQCQQITYLITNYPDDSQTVLVTLYVQGGSLIAGDIHSTAVNGFLHGLKME